MSNHKKRNKMSDQILEDWVGVPLPLLPPRARLGTTTAPETERIVVKVLMEVAVMIDVASTEFGDDEIVGIPTLVPDQHYSPDEIAAAMLATDDTVDSCMKESTRMFVAGDVITTGRSMFFDVESTGCGQ